MDLRPHQIKAIEMLRGSIKKGNKRPILAAPCSFGKTITAAYMLNEAVKKGKRGIFICDRIKLIEQSLEEFDGHGMDVGVIQGNHHMTDHSAPVQIASVQTLARRSRLPDFDFAIIDECHALHKHTIDMMKALNNVVFIGLSATPFSKGLGKYFNDLIVPITPEELLEQGFLCPIHYYGGRKVDTSNLNRRALPTGGTDYDPKSLELAVDRDQTLAGDIVQNWLRHGENSQTIAFSPSIKHSKHMVEIFQANGIAAEHIDGYMEPEMREVMYRAHDAGEFKILSCSKLLNVGYDAPNVRCLIDCYSTTSKIAYCQRAGRIARTAAGKDYAIYLDHSGNVRAHGFAEHIVPTELDMGDKAFSESKQLKTTTESKPWECPDCYQQRVGFNCPCGYEMPVKERLKTDNQTLKRMTSVDKAKATHTEKQKAQFLGELYLHAETKGYKRGWADRLYKSKFGDWPNGMAADEVVAVSDSVKKYIQYDMIRKVKGHWGHVRK